MSLFIIFAKLQSLFLCGEAEEAEHLFSGLQLFFDSELQLVYQCHISKIVESLDREVDGTQIGINTDLL